MIFGQMPPVNLIQLLPDPQNLLCVNRDIARLPEKPARRLMHHDTAMGQREPLLGRASAKDQTPHRGRLAHTHGRHGRGNVHHGVVDGESCGDGAAGGVDVEVDGGGGLVAFEEEELRDDGGGEGVVYGAVEADYTLGKEAGEDVICLKKKVRGGSLMSVDAVFLLGGM